MVYSNGRGRTADIMIRKADGDGDPDTGYSKDNPDIRLFFGTNDGVFHVIKNTETDASESGEDGRRHPGTHA